MLARLVSKSAIMTMANPFDPRIVAFATALHTARWLKKINQTELSTLLGISQPQYSMIETGSREPVPALVFDIEKHLGCEPGALSRFLGYIPCNEGGSDA